MKRMFVEVLCLGAVLAVVIDAWTWFIAHWALSLVVVGAVMAFISTGIWLYNRSRWASMTIAERDTAQRHVTLLWLPLMVVGSWWLLGRLGGFLGMVPRIVMKGLTTQEAILLAGAAVCLFLVVGVWIVVLEIRKRPMPPPRVVS